jgi:accessory colonization factor AcfC
VRVAISVLDCLKGVWEDVCGRAGLLEAVRKNISFYANGCIAIVQAVVQGKADVAFGWSSFAHLDPGIRILALPSEQSISRGTGIGLLSFSRQPRAATAFMDFLTTPPARDCYRRFGWEV